jgi:hypothetical protein
LESPFLSNNPRKTGIYKMFALNSKVAVVIACMLAMAIVIHLSVYLAIDAGSLSAQMPPR